MRYPGAKFHQAEKISEVINKVIGARYYLEPFCGALNVGLRINAKTRIMSDYDDNLIAMWQAVQSGWTPPSVVSQEMYYQVKANYQQGGDKYDKPTTAFVGYACSFGAKWWGGYARDHRTNVNFAQQAISSINKKIPLMSGMEFHATPYSTWDIEGAVIYCDPPYYNTTAGYRMKSFDHNLFWKQIITWSKNNIVFVSEFSCPFDVKPILELNMGNNMNVFSENKMVDKLYLFY